MHHPAFDASSSCSWVTILADQPSYLASFAPEGFPFDVEPWAFVGLYSVTFIIVDFDFATNFVAAVVVATINWACSF